MKLLIAEDDTRLLKSLIHIFEHNRFTVDGVSNGSDALAYAQTNQYDGLIFDVMMPELDGIKLDRLFDRFYREDSARTSGSGFGIGLSIAQSVTEHHKSSIKAVKADDGVIGFTVKL